MFHKTHSMPPFHRAKQSSQRSKQRLREREREREREMKEGSGGGRRSESDKEKTKMRERHRRAITTNIFHGLRKHGGYRLSPRADINEVLRELAKEAGWVIEPDGTTYRSKVSNICPLCGTVQTTTTTANNPAPTVADGGGEYPTTASGGILSNINAGSCSLLCLPKSFGGSCRQPISVPVLTFQELTGEAQSGDGGFVECSATATMTCQREGAVLHLEAVSAMSNQRTIMESPLHPF